MSNGGQADLAQGLIPQPSSPVASSTAQAGMNGVFTLQGAHVKLTLSDDVLSWKLVGKTRNCCGMCRVPEGEGERPAM